jgi:hypothetical protein
VRSAFQSITAYEKSQRAPSLFFVPFPIPYFS